MDQSDQAQHQPPVVGIVAGGGGAQMAYPPQPYQSVPPPPAIGPGAPAGVGGGPHQLAYQQAQHFHHQQQQQQQQQLQAFWSGQMQEIEQCSDFKNHSLPLARIKKIMKADEDVRMISAEAPVVFAKACEMFVLELTLRSWIHTEENKRRTLQKNDIGAAIARTDVFDFLVDIIPRDELKEEGLGMVVAGGGGKVPAAAAEMQQPPPYYYHHHPHPAGMMMGKPVVDQGGMYGVQPRPPMAFVPWPQSQSQNQNHQNQHQQQPQSDA